MSMTVNAVNYQSNMLQNARASSSEKLEQKDGVEKEGKTQKSAVSASLDQVNMGEDGIAVAEVDRQRGTGQSAARKQPAAPRMDTVEISEEGKAASAKLQRQSADTDAAEETQYEVEDLSEYTDLELKRMYYNGMLQYLKGEEHERQNSDVPRLATEGLNPIIL